MAQRTITATFADSISSANPTVNQATFAYGDPTASTDVRRGSLKFDFSSIPFGSTITAVVLQIYNVSNDASNNREVGIFRCKRAQTNAATWDTFDGSSNWGTAGASNTTSDIEAASIGTVTLTTGQAVEYFNITLTASKIQEMFEGVFTNNGFILMANNIGTEADDRHEFDSESDSNPPKLVVTYLESVNQSVFILQ